MKTKIVMSILTVLLVTKVGAQTIYDATTIASKDLNGTARFVGMGGAMGALGGDISTIGTNPAGIGIYRSNDLMLSFGYSTLQTENQYNGDIFKSDKNRWNFDNVGFVFSTKIGNATALRYVNFGFNYQKTKSFYRNMNSAGDLGGISLTDQMASMSDGITPGVWGNGNPFNNKDIGWLSALGYNGFLIDPSITTNKTDYPYQDENKNPIYDENGKPLYLDFGRYVSVLGENDHAYLREFRSWERGGINQFDFNVSFNVNDRVYFGVTIGAYDVDYRKSTLYDEDFRSKQGDPLGTGFILESNNKISGAGFDLKLGTIIRPFEYSPLRIGLAVHTPTFYNLTYTTSARLVSDLVFNNQLEATTVDSYKELNNKDMKAEYSLYTPWTYNVSLGYTVGSVLAIGAEYEYKDYSTMKFYYPEGDVMDWETQEAKSYLKGVNTFRIGAEYKVIPEFAFRLGYNYSSSAFKDEAIKDLPINSIQTDTEFSNLKSLSNYTLGIGYKGSRFYADLAYKYSVQKSDFYPFVFGENTGTSITYWTPEATKVTDSRSQVVFTLGMRF